MQKVERDAGSGNVGSGRGPGGAETGRGRTAADLEADRGQFSGSCARGATLTNRAARACRLTRTQLHTGYGARRIGEGRRDGVIR